MRIRVLGGVREIGGNKLLVECERGKILLDFGVSYQRESVYFDPPFLAPHDVEDMMKAGLLPEIRGLYGPGGWDGAVLISHAHWDHVGYVPVLGKGTRVMMGNAAWEIIKARGELSSRRDWRRSFDHLEVETFSTGDELEPVGGDLRVRPIHVDHSIPGSYGFLITCDGESLAYTGDLRLHGERGDLTNDFVEAARDEGVGVIVTEGTNLAPEGDPESAVVRLVEAAAAAKVGPRLPKRVRLEAKSEAEVGDRMKEVLEEEVDRLVVVDSGAADVDRIRTVWRVAESLGRRLVLSEAHAVIVDSLGGSGLVKDLPSTSDYDVMLRRKRARGKGRGEEARLEGRPEIVRSLVERIEGEVIWGKEGRERLLMDGAGYLIVTSDPARLLKDLLPVGGSEVGITFIMSRSEPFSEETALGLDRVLGWLTLYGVDVYYRIHVSGHAYPEDLARMIEEVDPRVVVPIHSLHPGLLRAYLPRRLRSRVTLPEEDLPIEVPGPDA